MHISYIFYIQLSCIRSDCVKKFKIPSVPPTTDKCIRFPNDIIEEVEEAISGK